MKILLYSACSLFLILGCASTQTTQNQKLVQNKNTSSPNRLPATHIYGGSSCSNPQFYLNYDGPGSNYAFGGLSNLYVKNQKNSEGETVKLLAYEDFDGTPEKVGAGEGSWGPLHIVYSEELSTRKGKVRVSPKRGDKCEPEEIDFQHSEWKANVVVRIDAISSEASQRTGLKAGSKLSFNCDKSSDVPFTCPKSGRYGNDNQPLVTK